MVNVTIDDLLDGSDIKDPTGLVAFNQGGITFKGTVKANSSEVYSVNSQAHLESLFGSDIEIPSESNVSLEFLESFTLNKPIKMGLNTVLKPFGATPETTVNYTGTGALFQQTVTFENIRALLLDKIFFTGDGTQLFCDLKGTSRLFMDTCRIEGFAGAIAEFPLIKLDNMAAVDWSKGWIIQNTPSVFITNSNTRQPTPRNMTLFSFISNVPSVVSIYENPPSVLQSGDSLFFFDPNSLAGSSYIAKTTSQTGGDFYQQGTDIAINSVADNGSSQSEFTTAISHGLVVGQLVVINGFVTETNYNGTFVVTAVDTPLTGTTFDVDVTFTGDDTGNMNANSLDHTSILVTATDNPGEADSMFIGGWFHSTNVASTIITDGTFVPLNLSTSGGVTEFIENERFSIDDANEGIMQYDGLIPKTVTLIGILSLMKGGSTSNYNLRYAIDRGEIDTAAVVLGGTGYVDAESVTLTGQTSGATTATATISVTGGVITAINIVSGGSQYIAGETLDVIGGSGSGATGTATLLGFVALPTLIERPQSISTTTRDTVLNQEVVLNTGNKIRMEIEGDGTSDSVDVIFTSLDIKG